MIFTKELGEMSDDVMKQLLIPFGPARLQALQVLKNTAKLRDQVKEVFRKIAQTHDEDKAVALYMSLTTSVIFNLFYNFFPPELRSEVFMTMLEADGQMFDAEKRGKIPT